MRVGIIGCGNISETYFNCQNILSIHTSTMVSYTKDTHRYAFELVKAARTMPVDLAEKLQHIKQLRFNYQLKALRKRINKRIT